MRRTALSSPSFLRCFPGTSQAKSWLLSIALARWVLSLALGWSECCRQSPATPAPDFSSCRCRSSWRGALSSGFTRSANRSHPHNRLIARKSQPSCAEILKSDAVCSPHLNPHLAETKAPRPSHEKNSPTAIVRMIPEVIQSQVQKHVFHELNKFQAHAHLFIG